MSNSYPYDLSTYFGGAVNEASLKDEINDNVSITIHCADVGRVGDDVVVTFLAALSGAEQTALESVVIPAHDSSPTPEEPRPVTVSPATTSYEMCDRDILIRTATYDARAQAVIPGAGPQATMAYVASSPGACGNNYWVEHTAGAAGAGHEDRDLDCAVGYNLGAVELSVIYGTDGNGNPIIPSAQQVHDMLMSKLLPTDPPFLMYAAPVLLADGSDLVSVTSLTQLQGGASPSLSDVKIHPLSYTKSEWNELQQIGVYKLDNGAYVDCPENEVGAEACLSVWCYRARHQTTGMPQIIEIRDGLLVVDENTSDDYEHQAFAVGAPLIPAALGGQVLQFDAYLKYYRGKVLGATSPQAKALNPNGPGGIAAAELRVYVYYPKGTQNTHVLRLVTYRPPGTF